MRIIRGSRNDHRLLFALALLALLLLALAACGRIGRAKQDPEQPGQTAQEGPGDAQTADAEPAEPEKPVRQEPVLTLAGGSLYYRSCQPGPFEDPGFSASDEQDGDLTDAVVVEGEVFGHKPGRYTLRYEVSDRDGHTAAAERTVVVYTRGPIEEVEPENKTIYLTFDDGPCVYTPKLLEVLDKYPEVKVTFFVTGQFGEGYQRLIGEEHARGHAIAVHSFTHRYDKCYTSVDDWYDDFMKMQEVIREQTGEYTRLYRFPGGSSNTVSRRYAKGVISEIAAQLSDMGCEYFDWNVASGDAAATTPPTSTIEANIKGGAKRHTASVVLQHDIKPESIAAVEAVIRWGLENGYEFRALEVGSPGAHHTIAN